MTRGHPKRSAPPASALYGQVISVSQGEAMRDNLADRMARMGGVLVCKVDGDHHRIPLGDVRRYMAEGWPRCCGQTMTWLTARELARGRTR